MDLLYEIEKNLREWGASLVGFSNVSQKLPDNLKKLEYAITAGVRLSDAIIDEIENKPTHTYFHHYRTVNFFLDQLALRTVLYLQEKGYKALAVPASQTVSSKGGEHYAIFPHKTAAVKAGLGWIGKSDLFISEEYGPRVRLVTILTDALLPVKKEHTRIDCGACRLCVDSCPAMALQGNNWDYDVSRQQIVDVKACSDYMNANFKHIGRGSVCGICVKVCPKGRKRAGIK